MPRAASVLIRRCAVRRRLPSLGSTRWIVSCRIWYQRGRCDLVNLQSEHFDKHTDDTKQTQVADDSRDHFDFTDEAGPKAKLGHFGGSDDGRQIDTGDS